MISCSENGRIESLEAKEASLAAEKDSKQKDITRVDRRWEFELLSRMREKLLNKAEKSMKSTRKRVVWGSNYFPTVALYIIRLYASSAFRFAALKSNRSYIPGD